jgi:hypothetical protein
VAEQRGPPGFAVLGGRHGHRSRVVSPILLRLPALLSLLLGFQVGNPSLDLVSGQASGDTPL